MNDSNAASGGPSNHCRIWIEVAVGAQGRVLEHLQEAGGMGSAPADA